MRGLTFDLGTPQPKRGLLTPGLTEPADAQLAERLATSAPGMAHWAGTGPEGRTCRSCRFWGRGTRFRRTEGILKRRECQVFITLMRGDHGPGVDHAQPSCRHYSPSFNVPPVAIKVRKARP